MGREANRGGLLRTLAAGYAAGDLERAERKAMEAVGRPVVCKYPGGYVRRGVLVHRRVGWSSSGEGDAAAGLTHYLLVRDRVRFNDHLGTAVRVSYYRVFPGGRLVWGGQTSLFAREEDYEKIGVTFLWGDQAEWLTPEREKDVG